eukprot:TRINITY_DN17303_c0_g1_i1.p1 TRINITY_DN17303_c0_g1~~TRINITY_DN17303_c0_g1_i1.p1  ORF type:complete len:385 (+),score=169.00 TRINITY_DN17303_c0_g1_i1:37-1155(+)
MAARTTPVRLQLKPVAARPQKKVYGLVVPKGFERPGDEAPQQQPSEAERRKHEGLARQGLLGGGSTSVSQRQAEQAQARALAEDPNAFAYDEVYDKITEGRRAQQQGREREAADRRPKFMPQLLAQAERRKHFLDVALANKIQRESEKDKELYGDMPSYVTASYRSQLKENKLWLDEEERLSATDVKDPNNLSFTQFYRNILDIKNQALGGGDSTQQQPSAEELAKTKANAVAALTEAVMQEATAEGTAPSAAEHHAAPAAAAGLGGGVAEYEQKLEEEQRKERERLAEEEREHQREDRRRRHEQQQNVEEQYRHVQVVKAQKLEHEHEAIAVKVARRNNDDTISAAKERYLARKALQDALRQQAQAQPQSQ